MDGERRLGEMTTTGIRRRIRAVVFAFAAACGLAALVALPFAGRWRGDAFVDTLTANSHIPLVMGILVEVALLFAWRGRLLRTVLLMPCAALAGLFAAFTTSFHGSTRIPAVSNDAEAFASTAFVVTALLCVAVFVVEWIVVGQERARITRAGAT